MIIDPHLVTLAAVVVVVVCTSLYLAIFIIGKRMDRDDARRSALFERKMDELLRR